MVIHMISRAFHGSTPAGVFRRCDAPRRPAARERAVGHCRTGARVVALKSVKKKGPFTKKNGKLTKKIWGIMFAIDVIYQVYHGWVFTELFWLRFISVDMSWCFCPWANEFTNSPTHDRLMWPQLRVYLHRFHRPFLLYIHDQNLFKCHKNPHVTVITALH